MRESQAPRALVSFGQCSEKMVFERAIPSSSTQNVLYGGISMTKFNKQELISNYPNCTCITGFLLRFVITGTFWQVRGTKMAA